MKAIERWSCWMGAVGSDDWRDYTLRSEELRWYGYSQEATYRQLPDGCGALPRLFGLDCEMVRTEAGPALARVSLVELVSSEPVIIYDAFVKPPMPVLDYLHEHSGVTPKSLEGVTRTASQALDELSALLCRDDIICGHNLSCDLDALQLSHEQIIDTQVLYPHQDGPPSRRSLAGLCQEHLKRKIQLRTHSPVGSA